MKPKFSRRQAIQSLSFLGLGILMPRLALANIMIEKISLRPIHSSGEMLPIVGLGTWQTFEIGSSYTERSSRKQVLKEMFKYGGAVVDSSPMYGSSEKVVGDLTSDSNFQESLFYATKVWTSGKDSGIQQIERSMKRMRRNKMDLIQVHNLQDCKTQVKTLKEWKEKGKIRYWGITHYVDSAHATLEKIITEEKPDFVQFNYSIFSRNAERSLFATADKNRTAVIINQPFETGTLFQLVKGKILPEWCNDYDISSWAQFFLKFILSNPSVTCVIPGTSKPYHMVDNMMAGYGNLPDKKGREKLYTYLKQL